MTAIRLYDPKDFATLAEMRRDLWLQHQLMAYPSGDKVTESDVMRWLDRRAAGGGFFVIADGNGHAAGFVQLVDIHGKGGYGFIGIALHERFRGAGHAGLAIQFLCAWARDRKMRKIITEVRADNPPAIAMYERNGFVRIGTFKRHYVPADAAYGCDVDIMETFI